MTRVTGASPWLIRQWGCGVIDWFLSSSLYFLSSMELKPYWGYGVIEWFLSSLSIVLCLNFLSSMELMH